MSFVCGSKFLRISEALILPDSHYLTPLFLFVGFTKLQPQKHCGEVNKTILKNTPKNMTLHLFIRKLKKVKITIIFSLFFRKTKVGGNRNPRNKKNVALATLLLTVFVTVQQSNWFTDGNDYRYTMCIPNSQK
jgi:hypothetical protein